MTVAGPEHEAVLAEFDRSGVAVGRQMAHAQCRLFALHVGTSPQYLVPQRMGRGRRFSRPMTDYGPLVGLTGPNRSETLPKFC